MFLSFSYLCLEILSLTFFYWQFLKYSLLPTAAATRVLPKAFAVLGNTLLHVCRNKGIQMTHLIQ